MVPVNGTDRYKALTALAVLLVAAIGHAAAQMFAAELADGKVPSVRRVRREMHLGQPRAQQVQAYLTELASSNGHG